LGVWWGRGKPEFSLQASSRNGYRGPGRLQLGQISLDSVSPYEPFRRPLTRLQYARISNRSAPADRPGLNLFCGVKNGIDPCVYIRVLLCPGTTGVGVRRLPTDRATCATAGRSTADSPPSRPGA